MWRWANAVIFVGSKVRKLREIDGVGWPMPLRNIGKRGLLGEENLHPRDAFFMQPTLLWAACCSTAWILRLLIALGIFSFLVLRRENLSLHPLLT